MPRPTAKSIALIFSVTCLAGALSACGSAAGGSISVEQYKEPPDRAAGEYQIGVGDMLSIQVWDQSQMSGRMRVRNDGRVSLPFVNDELAAGKTPSKLAGDIETSLKSVVLNPKVTVVVEDSKPLTISVLGEVAKPGPQALERDTGVAQALAAAGGLTNFAHKNRIYVVRASVPPVRIHFTYQALTRMAGAASSFRLKPGDVIVVE
jgi:polysaccharide export outer membrane protein